MRESKNPKPPETREALRIAQIEEEERVRLEGEVARLEALLRSLDGGGEPSEGVLGALNAQERATVAEEMGPAVQEPFEPASVNTDPETFLINQVVKDAAGIGISERMRRIVARLRRGVLRGVAISTIFFAHNSRGETIPISPSNASGEISPVSREEIQRVTQKETAGPKIDKPTYEQLSPAAQEIYLYAAANIDTTYIIVDKPRAEMYVIGADKMLVARFPVLLGKVRGEHENTADPDSDIAGPGATTPSGAYIVGWDLGSRSDSLLYKGNAFALYNPKKENVIGIHQTYPPELEERTRVLNTKNTEDNRVTYGCINVSGENFERYLKGSVPENAIVYITPDDPQERVNPKTGKLIKKGEWKEKSGK